MELPKDIEPQTTDMDSIQTFHRMQQISDVPQLRALSSSISDECWSKFRSVSPVQSYRNVIRSFSSITHNGLAMN